MSEPATTPEAPGINLAAYRHTRSFRYLLKRGLWACVQIPFLPGTPRILSGLRISLLRLFGARIGQRCLIVSGVKVWEPWNLEIGDFSVLGKNVEVYNLALIRLGSHCVVSQRTYLCSATHDYSDPSFPLYSKPIDIGSSAWVAAGVFVGPGIKIGEGAVVGAYSVVTKDVPSWMVCAGNPCRPLKRRRLKENSS
jgi:putative colanic acid biosynthesis acetyltransferase WcaF